MFTNIIEGAIALLLEAHPEWTPIQVREAILNTASEHNNPTPTLGWGLINITKGTQLNQLLLLNIT